jgi:hypothetical protein
VLELVARRRLLPLGVRFLTNRAVGTICHGPLFPKRLSRFLEIRRGLIPLGGNECLEITWTHFCTSAMVLETMISIEPDPGATTKLRSHFLRALPQIGANQGHEHRAEGKGPSPRLLGQITQIAAGALDEGGALQDCGKDHGRVFGAKCLDGFLPGAWADPEPGARTEAAVAIKSRQELIPLGACSAMSGQALRTIGKGKLRCGRSCCGLGSVCSGGS